MLIHTERHDPGVMMTYGHRGALEACENAWKIHLNIKLKATDKDWTKMNPQKNDFRTTENLHRRFGKLANQ